MPRDEYDDDDEPETVPCPHCRRDVYEDAEYCPGCDRYLSREDAPGASHSTFVWVMLVLAILAAAFWVVGG